LSEPYTGGCACGAIRYQLSGEPLFQNDCQCRPSSTPTTQLARGPAVSAPRPKIDAGSTSTTIVRSIRVRASAVIHALGRVLLLPRHPKPKELDMSTTQVRSETAIETPRARTVDMKLEVVVIPVSDVDRAKGF
jgi:hypothetical protein